MVKDGHEGGHLLRLPRALRARGPAPTGQTDGTGPEDTDGLPAAGEEVHLEPSRTLQYVAFESRTLRRAVIVVLALWLGLEVGRWAFAVLGHLLFLLLLSWLTAIAMEPPIAFFQRRGFRRGFGAGLVLLLLVALTLALLGLFGGLFFSQLASLVVSIPELVTAAVAWLNDTLHLNLDPQQIIEQFNISSAALTELATNLAGGVFGVVGSLLSVLFDALTVLVFAFYIAADGPRLRRTVGSWLPPAQQRVFVTGWQISLEKTGGFVVSKIVLATLSAVAHVAFFWAIDVPYWLPMGVFAGLVSQFIPTIGTYIGVAIPALFALFEQPLDAVWIILFATVYQQVENYVFTPRISRRTMDIHPALALGSVFVGAAFFGPIGALIGIPLAAAVLSAVQTYGHRYELVPELSGHPPAPPASEVPGAPVGPPREPG